MQFQIPDSRFQIPHSSFRIPHLRFRWLRETTIQPGIETFLGGPNEAIAQRLHVTITPQKLIRLNRNMYTALGRPSAVRLSYSRARDIIAIEPADTRQAEAFPVMPDSCGWRINSAPFCRHFKIEVESTLKFITPDLAGNTLYLSLAKTISVATRKRKKK